MVKDDKPYCEEHYHHPQQQAQKQPNFEQKAQQPLRQQQQEKKPPVIKPKPLITRKPDSTPKAEVKKPDITTYSSNISKPVRSPEINRPDINKYSSNALNTGSQKSPEAKRPDISSHSGTTSKPEKKVAPASTSGSKLCHQCNSAIDGPSASALGHDYHIHHFQCRQCSRALSSRVPGNNENMTTVERDISNS